MINILSGLRRDFADIRQMTPNNDASWSRKSMQEYYTRIERNTYLPRDKFEATHGFDGWLATSILPVDELLTNPQFAGEFST